MRRATIATAILATAIAAPSWAAKPHGDSARVIRRIVVNQQGVRVDHGEDDLRNSTVRIHGKDLTIRTSKSDSVRVSSRFFGGGHVIVVDAEDGLVRVFADADVPAGERVEGDVVAVFGSCRVQGTVSGNVVAVLGSVKLEPNAVVDGDVVAIGGGLEQPPGATVHGESVSLGFLPIHWGIPTLQSLLLVILIAWVLALVSGWVLMLLFPDRMRRVTQTASTRTGWSLVLGLCSAPLLVITMVLLLITVIGVPVAVLLPLVYLLAIWGGQMATTFLLGCRLLRRPLDRAGAFAPLAAGTGFVALFFVLGTMLAGPAGVLRTIALFFTLLGALLVFGLSVIGTGAVILSRIGAAPRNGSDYEASPQAAPMAAAPPAVQPGA